MNFQPKPRNSLAKRVSKNSQNWKIPTRITEIIKLNLEKYKIWKQQFKEHKTSPDSILENKSMPKPQLETQTLQKTWETSIIIIIAIRVIRSIQKPLLSWILCPNTIQNTKQTGMCEQFPYHKKNYKKKNPNVTQFTSLKT